MNTLGITLRYRPVRIGWCVQQGDLDAFRMAARWSFTMWGGRFNPIIPIDDANLAKRLIDLYRVDCLYPATENDAVKAFIEEQRHLRWIDWQVALTSDQGHGSKASTIADIMHPIGKIYDKHHKHNLHSEPIIQLHDWGPEDPLADMLLMSFGGVPPANECSEDYLAIIRLRLKGEQTRIARDGPVWPLAEKWTLASLNRAFIDKHYAVQNNWDYPGFYVGDVSNFMDLVNCWNLRAADVPVLFYDHAFSERLSPLRQDWITRAPRSLRPGREAGLALWHRTETELPGQDLFGEQITQCRMSDGLWNGMNIQAPIMHFGSAETLASVDTSGETPEISFSLPDSPFKDMGRFGSDAYVVSVDPGIGLFSNEHFTLHMPFVPQLNEYYGRNAIHIWDKARAEPDSIGIVSTARTNHLSIHALEVGQLVKEIFAAIGIAAEPSAAGLVCTRLIMQMGGIDKSRVFRIGGVRELIENHSPNQSFTQSYAKQTIRAEGTAYPLSLYENLYIESRPPGTKLTNDAVLSHLLKKGVFRPGLKLSCPNCRLDFWTSLDDLRTNTGCEYCGQVSNIGPQLKDRDWAFRRSGLFGRSDNQEGAIPVVLTLQQLAHIGSLSKQLQTTAMTLESSGADISSCEVDFVVINQRTRDQKIQIAIGECKTRGTITKADVRNLVRVAEAFPKDRYEVFLIFAKLADFSREELTYIQETNGQKGVPHRRAIILTTRELEPWFVYERTEREFEINRHAVSFEDLAEVTQAVFFERRLKAQPSGDNAK